MGPLICLHVMNQKGFTRVENVEAKASDRARLVWVADALLDRVRVVDAVVCGVVQANVNYLGIEDLVQLVAHELVHLLHVELLRQALLDAVDDRQLSGALVGFLEQVLRLRDRASATERRRDMLADEVEQLDVLGA